MNGLPDKGAAPDDYSEGARLRQSDKTAADDRSRVATPPSPGAACRLVQTKTVTTYPTTAAAYYACTPLDALGTQTEGSTGSLSTRPGTLYALNLGSAIPPNGTRLIVHEAGYRWVFRFDG